MLVDHGSRVDVPMFQLLLNADVHAPQPKRRQHVLIAAGKIVWIDPVVPKLDARLPTNAVDLEGRRLIPGLGA